MNPIVYRCRLEMDAYEYGNMPAPVTYGVIEIIVEAISITQATRKFLEYFNTAYSSHDDIGDYTKLTIEAVGFVTKIEVDKEIQ